MPRSHCREIVVAQPLSFFAGPWIEIPCRSVANEWWLANSSACEFSMILCSQNGFFNQEEWNPHSSCKFIREKAAPTLQLLNSFAVTRCFPDTNIFNLVYFVLVSSCKSKIRFWQWLRKGMWAEVWNLHSPNVNCFLKSHIIYCICRSKDRAKCNELAICYTLLWLLQAALSVNSSTYLISGSITLFLFLP